MRVDYLTANSAGMMSILNDSILTFENRLTNCIQFYNLNQQAFISELCFDIRGPNGTGPLIGYLVETLDSIYIMGDHTRSVVLANQRSEVVSAFKLSRHDFGTPVGGTFFPIRRIDNILYFAAPINHNIYTVSSVGGILEIAYDLNTQTHTEHFHLPEEYDGFHNTYYITFSRDIDAAGNFVYSFPMCHDLYIKSPQGKVRKVAASSPYALGTTIRKNTIINDNTDEIKADIEGYKYRFIVYDPYRSVYYRFVTHPMSYLDPATGLPRRRDEKPFSIIILDKNFNKIGERVFPAKQYLIDNYFLNSRGLWISNNHPANPEMEEDYLSFTLLKLAYDEE